MSRVVLISRRQGLLGPSQLFLSAFPDRFDVQSSMASLPEPLPGVRRLFELLDEQQEPFLLKNVSDLNISDHHSSQLSPVSVLDFHSSENECSSIDNQSKEEISSSISKSIYFSHLHSYNKIRRGLEKNKQIVDKIVIEIEAAIFEEIQEETVLQMLEFHSCTFCTECIRY
ncbi:hypothetical protein J5N97_008610 [Dioscorea zingiberensis]|uniref:Uncharacterized protein n=1 Tax=Dioscorea zingiberensis TaxID=325984 RepID=A0A9D5HKS1_9LILI|nr:hypothetical protein J5N97_008610 [Dioscorea zingiberensis]